MEKVLGWLVAYLTFLYVGYSSPTRDQTWAPCIGSVGSQPLDHQGGPSVPTLLLSEYFAPSSKPVHSDLHYYSSNELTALLSSSY